MVGQSGRADRDNQKWYVESDFHRRAALNDDLCEKRSYRFDESDRGGSKQDDGRQIDGAGCIDRSAAPRQGNLGGIRDDDQTYKQKDFPESIQRKVLHEVGKKSEAQNYVQKVKKVLQRDKALLWIKKMERLGVIEISEPSNKL